VHLVPEQWSQNPELADFSSFAELMIKRPNSWKSLNSQKKRELVGTHGKEEKKAFLSPS